MNLPKAILTKTLADTAEVMTDDRFGADAVFSQTPRCSRNLNSSSPNLHRCSRNLAESSRNLNPSSRNLPANSNSMCRVLELRMAFPDALNDSRQAYTTRKT